MSDPRLANCLLSSTDETSAEVVEKLLRVCFPDAVTIYDPTYGNGAFWRETTRKVWGSDLMPERAKDFVADYWTLPFADNSVDVVVFDPPFQPTGKSVGLMAKRFTTITHEDGGVSFRNLDALKESVQIGALETMRVARLGVVIKVQDYIQSRCAVWMSMWLWEVLGEPYDFVTVRTKGKMLPKSVKTQLSTWRNHSTYWVFSKRGKYHVTRSAA